MTPFFNGTIDSIFSVPVGIVEKFLFAVEILLILSVHSRTRAFFICSAFPLLIFILHSLDGPLRNSVYLTSRSAGEKPLESFLQNILAFRRYFLMNIIGRAHDIILHL